jgi:hypothetical protein
MSERRKIVAGALMRIHYPQNFLGAPVIELPDETLASVFNEMDTAAEKLRQHEEFIEQDLQYAFFQIQRKRINLSKDKWLWLFDLWRDHDRGLQVILDAERAALWDSLIDERETLFRTRARYPEHAAKMTARLMDIGRALADLQLRIPNEFGI